MSARGRKRELAGLDGKFAAAYWAKFVVGWYAMLYITLGTILHWAEYLLRKMGYIQYIYILSSPFGEKVQVYAK